MNKMNLIQGDCLEKMKEMVDRSVDLTVTSPPYDNLRSYNDKISQWNFDKFKEIVKELYRVTIDGGIIVWVVGDATIKGSETGTSFKQALWFMECGFKLHDTMIFEKKSSSFPASRTSKRYTQIFEYMFIFSKGNIRKDISLLCDKKNKWYGYTNWGNNTHYSKDGKLIQTNNIKPIPEYSLRNNIWEYSIGFNDKTGHPAVFPEQLANDHIISWSNEGNTVFDPFMGSGTTGKMAMLNNRNFIGIEIDEEYFKIAKNRIENAIKKL